MKVTECLIIKKKKKYLKALKVEFVFLLVNVGNGGDLVRHAYFVCLKNLRALKIEFVSLLGQCW